MRRRTLLALPAAALLSAAITATHAGATGEEMLVVRQGPDAGPSVIFTEEELKALPQVTVETATEFTDGVVSFTGPLARDVLAAANLGAADVAHLVAANDYALDVPVSDFMNYNVILAMEANGKKLSRRDKGPIWLMYPLDDHEELQDPAYTIRLIWQLTTVELR